MISFPRVMILRKNITNHNNIMRITTFVIAATIFIFFYRHCIFQRKFVWSVVKSNEVSIMS